MWNTTPATDKPANITTVIRITWKKGSVPLMHKKRCASDTLIEGHDFIVILSVVSK